MKITAFLSLCCAVLSFVIYYKKLYILSVVGDAVKYIWKARNELVLIVILSSQDHFEQRQSVRDTWLKLADGHGIKHYFLIGKTICPINPEDRISTLECEEQIVSTSESTRDDTLLKTISDHSNRSEQCSVVGDGFAFTVYHSIVVQQLGIDATVLMYSNSSAVRVALVDSASLEKIVSATFHHSILDEMYTFNDYLWKRVNPTVLPAGFEGEVSIIGLSDDLQAYNSSFEVIAPNGCVRITEILKNGLFSKYSGSECSLSSFSYTIKDVWSLQNHVHNHYYREQVWTVFMKTLYEKLQKEAEEKQDILFLDMVDVYRNLPTKMLMFYEWLAKQNTVYQYFLKTDDDTFVDVHKVVAELQKDKDWDWWSCFRIDWPVQRAGKWKEIQYTKNTYPPFPSGSGYVLTWNVVETLTKRAEDLEKNYQGEDVALGLWLEEFNLMRHVGTNCYWACDDNCHQNICNLAQLTVKDMYTVWRSFEEYNEIICAYSQ